MRGEWSPHQLVCTLNVFMICSLNQRIFIIWWYECWSVFCHYSCSCLVMSSHHHLDIDEPMGKEYWQKYKYTNVNKEKHKTPWHWWAHGQGRQERRRRGRSPRAKSLRPLFDSPSWMRGSCWLSLIYFYSLSSLKYLVGTYQWSQRQKTRKWWKWALPWKDNSQESEMFSLIFNYLTW